MITLLWNGVEYLVRPSKHKFLLLQGCEYSIKSSRLYQKILSNPFASLVNNEIVFVEDAIGLRRGTSSKALGSIRNDIKKIVEIIL